MDTQPRPSDLVGLGLVGQALAQRLLARRLRRAWLRPARGSARAPAALGGTALRFGCARVGAQCACVLLAVFDTKDVLAVLEGEGGLLSPGHAVRTVIDCSTGTPERPAGTRRAPARARHRLHRSAAVRIEPADRRRRGDAAAGRRGRRHRALRGGARRDRARSACTSAPPAWRAKAKLATNLVLGLNRAVLAEGMAFAESLGIPPETFLALVLATPARSVAAEVKGPLMVSGRFEPQSRIRQHLKDVGLMLEAAQAAGQPLPLSKPMRA